MGGICQTDGLELSYHIHTNLLVDSIDDWRFYTSLLKTAKLCIDVSHAELWATMAQSLIDLPAAQLRPLAITPPAPAARCYHSPVWVDVGCAEGGLCRLSQSVNYRYNRWVTCVPGDTILVKKTRSAKPAAAKRMVEFADWILNSKQGTRAEFIPMKRCLYLNLTNPHLSSNCRSNVVDMAKFSLLYSAWFNNGKSDSGWYR